MYAGFGDGGFGAAAVAFWVSVGTPVLAGMCGAVVATRRRDVTVAVLSGVAVVLTGLCLAAAAALGVGGVGFVWLAKLALLLMAGFAVLCVGIGAWRGVRRAGVVDLPRV